MTPNTTATSLPRNHSNGADPPPPDYCAYTNITLPRPFPAPAAPTAPLPWQLAAATTGVPSSIGAFTLHGQKRQSPIRNEDGVIAFDLVLNPSRLPASGLAESAHSSQQVASQATTHDGSQSWSQEQASNGHQPPAVAYSFSSPEHSGRYRVRAAAIMDGHGGSNSATGGVPASPGALATALAVRLLPSFLDLLIHLDHSLVGPHTLPCLQGPMLNQSYEDTLHHVLAHFRDLFNAYMVARRPSNIQTEVLDEAGCTLCLVLRLSPSTIFAVNVGDSSMVAVDPTTDPPTVLNIWPTDAVAHPPCPLQRDSRASVRVHYPPLSPPDIKHYTASLLSGSFEDTISKYPASCFDSQTRHLLFHDVSCLDDFLKEKKSAPSGGERLLVVPATSHRLRLINSLANLHHHRAGAFVPRSTVYRFATASLPRDTTFLLMTDGVREKIRDTPCMASVAHALATGPEACEALIRTWMSNGGIWRPRSPSPSPNKQQSPTMASSSSGVATPPSVEDDPHGSTAKRESPPRQKHIRASHFAALLNDLSRGFSPFQTVSPRSSVAVQRLAQLFTAPANQDTDMLRLAESLVQLAMLRASVDDLTCLAWRVLHDDMPGAAKGDQSDGELDGMSVDGPDESQGGSNGRPEIVWLAASTAALHHVQLDDEPAQSQ